MQAVRNTEYYWRTRGGNIPHTTSTVGDGSLELADCYFDTVEDAERYLENLHDQGQLDEIEGATMYATDGEKMMEDTDVITEQAGFNDYL